MRNRDTSLGGAGVNFSETVWGMIERARDAEPAVRQAGLDELARNYWKPVYHYLRVAWAKSNDDAKDLTQAFFLWLVDTQALKRYQPEKGSFRTFLKALLRHFVQHRDEALERLKRGGGRTFLHLEGDDQSLEGMLPDSKATDPEESFEQQWRQTLLARAVGCVRERLLAEGVAIKFRVFESYYLNASPEERPTYSGIASALGLTGSEVQHKLAEVREDIRNEIRAQLARTVSGPEELEEEWHAFVGS
jgi:RNA polymerase sigma-70 factor (ECF subfamily)